MLRRMHDDNAPPPFPPPDPAAPPVPPIAPVAASAATPWQDATEPVSEAEPPAPPHVRVPYALRIWLGLLVVFGAGGVLFGQQEMALLVALSGVAVAAQAADIDPRWRPLYQFVSVAFIGLCAMLFVGLASYFFVTNLADRRVALTVFSAFAALLIAATTLPAVVRPFVRALFRTTDTDHELRLATRLVLVGFLLPLPAWFVAQDLLADPEQALRAFGQLSEAGTLIGYVMLAFAAVGFLVRRDLRATCERLGLGPVGARNAVLIVIGVPLMFGLNTGADWIQHHWFPALWEQDRRTNEAIVSALDPRAMLIVGMSAGIGEEITMRGALQPRLGIVLTALLFAGLHVQYSWFGMATVGLFGIILGVIRQRSNTTVAIVIHVLYDILALFTT